VSAFAAGSDTPFGVLGSLLTGGGVWASEAVPPGRSAGAWISLALLAVAAAGLPALQRRCGARMLVAGAVGLLLALLGAVPLGRDLLRALVEQPAGGLLRDGQKWVAPALLVLSAALGCGVERALAQVREVPARRVLAAVLVLAPVAALPGAAWAESGRLQSSSYPSAWSTVTARATGVVAVLPWTLYRAFPWSGSQPVLDPATKLLAHPVLNDDLPLAGGVVRGEDPVARVLAPAMSSGEPLLPALQRAGIEQVLVERTTAGADLARVARQVQGLQPVTTTDELALYAVPGVTRASLPRVAAAPVVAGDLLALALGVTALVQAVRVRRVFLPLPG
jgi:hypothetical protein